ncbi:ribokinase [Nakamurella leprariae]|uniref:Ribokinase n=1 Tax=Nakamurella leprariae TaxID=2803911 RepID=A0A938YBG4_9ACTN|nr:ribokinase [Nakamurella leprariae]MBM9469441.1 ribokinase [Nakamurella leprariae]
MSAHRHRAPHRILVVGSINLDLVVTAPTIPAPGQTLMGSTLLRRPGGKGANQALAARRLGAEVTMFGLVGADSDGLDATALLRREGVFLPLIDAPDGLPDDIRSGVAVITVDAAGENTIVVVPGANDRLTPELLPETITGYDAVICQLEVPMATVAAVAARVDGVFCVNAAPAAVLPAEVVRRADLIVVNEGEYADLRDQLDAAPGLVVRTLGAAGAETVRSGAVTASARPPRVEVVDTVGAGDASVAGLVVGMLDGRTDEDLLAFGCAVGALTTTKSGAQEATPTLPQVLAVLD